MDDCICFFIVNQYAATVLVSVNNSVVDKCFIICCEVQAGNSNIFAWKTYIFVIGAGVNQYCIAMRWGIDGILNDGVISCTVLFYGDDLGDGCLGEQ